MSQPIVALWHHLASDIMLNIDSGNGLLPLSWEQIIMIFE